MIYDLWYRVSRTVFPFISLKRYHEICDDYDALIDDLHNRIQDLHNELDAMWYPVSSWDGTVTSIDLPATVESFEPITGKSVTVSETFTLSATEPYEIVICNTDDDDIARMDNEGPVNPAQWKKD